MGKCWKLSKTGDRGRPVFLPLFAMLGRGSKRWRFKKGPVKNNVRALTPHFQLGPQIRRVTAVHSRQSWHCSMASLKTNCFAVVKCCEIRTKANFEQQMKLHVISDVWPQFLCLDHTKYKDMKCNSAKNQGGCFRQMVILAELDPWCRPGEIRSLPGLSSSHQITSLPMQMWWTSLRVMSSITLLAFGTMSSALGSPSKNFEQSIPLRSFMVFSVSFYDFARSAPYLCHAE